jgi:4-amino-4-deoxy-L-arabinose transferase-like glycosyltransferase
MRASGTPIRRLRYQVPLLLILILAAILRLYGYAGGLPSINDPDEPLFVILAGKMLAGHGLNPHWFGHPGTTTIYSLALVYIGVLGAHLASGAATDISSFMTLVYGDPSIMFASGRLVIVAFGILSVLLTAMIAHRLFGGVTALAAALFLAINPLHVTYSQIIRTDVQATAFMLMCVLCAINIGRLGRLKDYVAAGVCVGLACATKWPAATIIVCVVGASVVRFYGPAGGRMQFGYLGAAFAAALATLFLVSPYLLLDYQTVIANLSGEIQTHHLGATGGGFLDNLGWYLANPLAGSFGWAGLALALAGLVMLRGDRLAFALIVPPICTLLLFISLQNLVWERWVVPAVPFLCIALAYALGRVWAWLGQPLRKRWATGLVAAVTVALSLPMLLAVRANAAERITDTRNLAAAWARQNIPAGSTILVEHFGFDLLKTGRWPLLFPAGGIGCIDVAQALGGQLRYSTTKSWRSDRAIVDFGTIDAARLDTCRADYAIFSHYDRYAAERTTFPAEAAQYEKAMAEGEVMRVIRPVPGQIGGRTVRIVRFRHSPGS